MEILVFTLNAIFVYFFSDWILRQIEQRRGALLKHRQLVFFGIIVGLALISFEVLKRLFGGA
ncbi:MAG: hypothetical protein OQK99_07275 [Gammaproteobacteria bacterium]|jgi:hypothetical protein|nr:hypothetical protein [Gammaproteobacteria bacterium]